MNSKQLFAIDPNLTTHIAKMTEQYLEVTDTMSLAAKKGLMNLEELFLKCE